MPTQVQMANDLYNRLKPIALKQPREYVMARTPAYLVDEMITLIDNDIPPTEIPTVVDAPLIWQTGTTLSCTLGNWNGAPSARTYQWKIAGVNVGTSSANYTRVAGDIGKPAVCVMTATNIIGTSAPVTSNEIVVI